MISICSTSSSFSKEYITHTYACKLHIVWSLRSVLSPTYISSWELICCSGSIFQLYKYCRRLLVYYYNLSFSFLDKILAGMSSWQMAYYHLLMSHVFLTLSSNVMLSKMWFLIVWNLFPRTCLTGSGISLLNRASQIVHSTPAPPPPPAPSLNFDFPSPWLLLF